MESNQIKCPYCDKINDITEIKCSCGYYFNETKYKEEMMNKPKVNQSLLEGIKFPKFWLGLFFVIIPFVLIILVKGPDTIERVNLTPKIEDGQTVIQGNFMQDITPTHPMVPYAALVVIAGWIFWIYCIYQMHKILEKMTNKSYPIKPKKAAFFHLIPLFNLYWIFKWTNNLIDLYNQQTEKRLAHGGSGVLLLVSFIIVYICLIPPQAVLAHALALAIVLIVGMIQIKRVRIIVSKILSTNK
jgi:hypothetical protein